jgi:hypothetical protein
MKKTLAIGILILAAAVFQFTSCSQKIGGTVQGDTFVTEGWIDNDTFRLAAAGVPTRTLTNKIARQESAKRAAILNAQYQVIEKFKGSKIEGAAGMHNFEMTGIAIAQELKAVVKGGSVKKVTYDAEDNCEIIYEVKAKDLKKKVEASDFAK